MGKLTASTGQIRHHEGPCIAAFDDKELVGTEDLTQETRWPLFSAAAVDRAVRAVLSGQPHPWSAEGELALLAFTDLAALLIASMMRGQQQSELAAQLQTALDSRTVIEQAKGVLIGQQGMSPRAAYELLRARARSRRRKLSAVSADVVRSAANSG